MRRTAVPALALLAAACGEAPTAPSAAPPAAPSLAKAGAPSAAAAPIPYVLSAPKVIGSTTAEDFYRDPNLPDAELAGAAVVWEYRDDAFWGPYHVLRTSLASGTRTSLAELDGGPGTPQASDRWTAWRADDSTLVVMDNGSRKQRRVTVPRLRDFRVAGEQVAVARYSGPEGTEVRVYDARTGTSRTVAAFSMDGRAPYAAELAFDGRWLAVRVMGNTSAIEVVDTRTGQSRLAVPFPDAGNVSPPWVDAGRMAYSITVDGVSTTYVQDLATGAVRTISRAGTAVPPGSYAPKQPQWNPRISGSLVVWQDMRNDSTSPWNPMPFIHDIYLYDLATALEMPVTNGHAWARDPRVDGNRVLWTQSRTGAGAGSYWDLLEADLTPVSVPVLVRELRQMTAAGQVPSLLGRTLESLLARAGSGHGPAAADVLRQFQARVRQAAGTQIDAASARRLDGIAGGILVREGAAARGPGGR